MPRYCLDLDTPAEGFIDSFLIGNGWLGATVRGGIGTERFDLNLDTVWSGGPLTPEEGEGPAHLIPELRDALHRRDYLRADELGRALQGERFTQSYQPLGAIELDYADGLDATGYGRRLDLSEAVATTRCSGVEVQSFVSHPDGVLVAIARGQGGRDATKSGLRFVPAHPDTAISVSEEHGTVWLVATARVPIHVLPNYRDGEAPVRYDPAAPAADGTIAAGMGYAVVAALHRDRAGNLRLVASAASGFRGHDQRPSADFAALVVAARERVAAALDGDTEDLRQRHHDDYRSYFDRVDLDLGASGEQAARAELLFHFGRYLMISSSRPGTEASNLQGIWNVDVRPAWSSNYTININTQMNYWPAEATGLADLHEPMFKLTRELAHAGAATARRYYGARGATAHHNADLWRFTAPVPGIPQWSNWPSGLYWMAAHLQHHLDFGAAGSDFAATALPVFRAATEFALDMLVEDASGALVASPSTSPEHSFLIDDTPVAITEGSAMDQELIRETLESFVALAGTADPLAARARAALARLRPPLIGPGGNLLEWDDDKAPAELGHRHLSHLYGLYPGIRITEAGTPAAFEAVRRALYLRLDNGTGYTGWSQAWVLCLAARLRDHALAERSIAGLLDHLTSRALLVLHPHTGWPEGNVFQIDGNFGAVAGLAELAVQSHEGAIALLKTLPPSWPSGTITNIRCRGGHQASVTWRDGALVRATIVAGQGGDLVLDLPHGAVAVTAASAPVATRLATGAAPGRTRLAWSATAGNRYLVTPA